MGRAPGQAGKRQGGAWPLLGALAAHPFAPAALLLLLLPPLPPPPLLLLPAPLQLLLPPLQTLLRLQLC